MANMFGDVTDLTAPSPALYHGGGMTLRVHLEMLLTNSDKLLHNVLKSC